MPKSIRKKTYKEALLLIGTVAVFTIGSWFAFSVVEKRQADMEKNDLSTQATSGDQAGKSSGTAPTAGSYAPDFTLEDTTGTKISLSDFKEQDTLIVFWKTTCGYCKKELPSLKEFVKENEDRLEVVAIDIREPKKVVQKYVSDNDINFKVLLDENGEAANNYWVTGTPSHFLIDKEGKIISTRPGYASRENLDSLLGHLVTN